jgi:hypothetical protein
MDGLGGDKICKFKTSKVTFLYSEYYKYTEEEISKKDPQYRTYLRMLNVGKTDAVFGLREKDEDRSRWLETIEIQQKMAHSKNKNFHKITINEKQKMDEMLENEEKHPNCLVFRDENDERCYSTIENIVSHELKKNNKYEFKVKVQNKKTKLRETVIAKPKDFCFNWDAIRTVTRYTQDNIVDKQALYQINKKVASAKLVPDRKMEMKKEANDKEELTLKGVEGVVGTGFQENE